jgi:hypothetical protein
MSLIEGFEDFITHIKNQEIRIKKQETIINYLKDDLNVALAERDQADEYHDRFLNYNICYIIYYVMKYKFKNIFEPQKIYKFLKK